MWCLQNLLNKIWIYSKKKITKNCVMIERHAPHKICLMETFFALCFLQTWRKTLNVLNTNCHKKLFAATKAQKSAGIFTQYVAQFKYFGECFKSTYTICSRTSKAPDEINGWPNGILMMGKLTELKQNRTNNLNLFELNNLYNLLQVT